MTKLIDAKTLGALLALTAFGCVPNPPEAEPPEVEEVSGGELPEYDEGRPADLDEEDDELALDLDDELDDFDGAARFLEG